MSLTNITFYNWTDTKMFLPLFLVLSSVSAQEQECPADWFDAGSLGCYKFLDGKVNLTWVEAQLACEQEGGFLAEPTSQLQLDFLSELALLQGGFTGVTHWYIGLTDLARRVSGPGFTVAWIWIMLMRFGAVTSQITRAGTVMTVW